MSCGHQQMRGPAAEARSGKGARALRVLEPSSISQRNCGVSLGPPWSLQGGYRILKDTPPPPKITGQVFRTLLKLRIFTGRSCFLPMDFPFAGWCSERRPREPCKSATVGQAIPTALLAATAAWHCMTACLVCLACPEFGSYGNCCHWHSVPC